MQDFSQFTFHYQDIEHPVYKKGSGPGVIIMHEMPGMITECVNFGRRLAREGFTVYLPLLFGKENIPYSVATTLVHTAGLCISREFHLLAHNKTSPIIEWLKALCRQAHQQCGFGGVGAIGMCLTGGFAIPMLVEPALMAAALSQPSLPLGFDRASKLSPGCSRQDFEHVCQRVQQENIPVLGFRFSHDIISPDEKFQYLEEHLGENFRATRIDSAPGNPHNNPADAHAVFTVHFQNQQNHPTAQALQTLIDYYKQRLLPEDG